MSESKKSYQFPTGCVCGGGGGARGAGVLSVLRPK